MNHNSAPESSQSDQPPHTSPPPGPPTRYRTRRGGTLTVGGTTATVREEENYLLATVDQKRTRIRDLIPALRTPGLGNKVQAVYEVYQHHRIGRGFSRYTLQNGKLAAGGISYMTIFSLGAAITVGWTLFAHFFSANSGFQTLTIEAINQLIPGLIANPAVGTEGLINPTNIEAGGGNTITGLVALGITAWSASRIVKYLVDGIRSMFGLMLYPGNAVSATIRQGIGLLLLFLAVLATVGLGILTTWAEAWTNANLPDTPNLFDNASFDAARLLIPMAVDFVMFFVTVRYVAQVRVPYQSLVKGSVAYALGSFVLRVSGSAIVGSTHDLLLATIATAATLLLWINFLARISLMLCSWMADPPAVVVKVPQDQVHAHSTPNYVSLSDEESLRWPHNPITGDLIPAVALVTTGPVVTDDVLTAVIQEVKKDHTAEEKAAVSGNAIQPSKVPVDATAVDETAKRIRSHPHTR